MPGVSIIIPTLNEAGCLERMLRHLAILAPAAEEILVVDGGSGDGTVALAQRVFSTFPATVTTRVLICDRPGRSFQMNQGAVVATGDILCFLHADTLVPDDLVTVVAQTLANPRIACGGFISLMTGPAGTRWGISLHNTLKTYYAPLLFRPHRFVRGLRLLFGDQVMFCRRRDFLTCGGFAPVPIMEEADLRLKLSHLGRICQVNRVVQSSDRRVACWGPLKANFIYLAIGFLWGFGVSPQYLKKFYEDIR